MLLLRVYNDQLVFLNSQTSIPWITFQPLCSSLHLCVALIINPKPSITLQNYKWRQIKIMIEKQFIFFNPQLLYEGVVKLKCINKLIIKFSLISSWQAVNTMALTNQQGHILEWQRSLCCTCKKQKQNVGHIKKKAPKALKKLTKHTQWQNVLPHIKLMTNLII